MTHAGDDIDVSASQAEVTDNLKTPVVSSQVERSSAILDEEEHGKSVFIQE